MQLAGILMDTGNLTNNYCSSKDKYMATLLIHGAGRFGCNGLYQICMFLILLLCMNVLVILIVAFHSYVIRKVQFVWFAVRYKMYDVSELKVIDILRKDFKRWTRVGEDLH